MKDSPLLGIDVGTRGVRAGVYLSDGTRVAEAEVPIVTRHPRPGWAEQSPTQVLDAVFAALSWLSKTAPQPAAMALACTAVTVIPVAPNGDALGEAILWMDTRASEEADEVNGIGHPTLANTGGLVSAEWMLPKALWLKRNDAQRYSQAQRIVELHDWLMFQLTGQWTLAKATVCAEWSYDPVTARWPTALLEQVGIEDVLAGWAVPILPPGAVAGSLSPQAAARTGLVSGTVVAQGLMDSYAAALACNIFKSGRTAVSIGTSSSYLALTTSSSAHAGLLGPVPEVFAPGTFVQQGGQTSAAALVDWFSHQLAPGESLAELDRQARAVRPGCDGLWAIDTWQGSRTPYRNPEARGAWGGLSLGHTRAHLFRAILEAVAYGGRVVLDTFAEADILSDTLGVVGGVTKSDLWMQMHSDVTGRELTEAGQGMAVASGAAMCAAVGLGAYSDLTEAAGAMHRPGRTWIPDDQRHREYQEPYERYLAQIRNGQAQPL